MSKIDYKKEFKKFYNPSVKEIAIVEIPKMNFLKIDGEGNPNTSQAFKDGVEALYSLSYTLKFMIKKGQEAIDYTVMPLEGLWWTDDMKDFSLDNKDIWKWTLMIMQPEFITQELFETAFREVKKKKNPVSLDKVRFESFSEGLVAQTMHIGPYEAEEPTIRRIHNFIIENGYELIDKHHEIYLSDPRKATPEKMKTVLRQPIRVR